MPTRAGIYARISADRDGTRLGVERQESDCAALCAARGWEVAHTYVDNDVSAYSGRTRPGYEQLLTAIADGSVDAVVAWHPDRLHRSPAELERFIDLVEHHRVAVATVQGGQYDLSTAAGRMTARVVGAVARHESEHKSERHRAKATQLALAGQVGGGGTRPYGYDDDRVTIRVDEAAVIRTAARRVLAGESLRGVCVDLNDRGVATVTGRPWTTTVLRTMLISPRIAGLRAHRGRIVAEAVWSAIIGRADHERLVHLLTDPARTVNRHPRRYPLTGLTRCGLCDTPLVARPRSDRARCYVCSTGPGFNGCGRIRVLAEPLEDLVARQVWALVDSDRLAERITGRNRPDEQAVVAEITAGEARLDALAAEWADGALDRRSWATARERLTRRLDTLRGSLVAAPAESVLDAYAGRPGALEAGWADLRVDQQRAVISAVVEAVVVGPAIRGLGRFDPDRVTVRRR
jgi:site-specific DNA recombinase